MGSFDFDFTLGKVIWVYLNDLPMPFDLLFRIYKNLSQDEKERLLEWKMPPSL